ncbi:hypothetical protein ACFC58_36160 [Kitasatospora purpeofusca]|uniref:hypothetical protein n=1 Tax=Kitasatospora purpeofusca TaxID=67352 RepID=UPI0035D8CBB0
MTVELWTIDQVADYLGAASAKSASRTLSRWGIRATRYTPHPASGRPRAEYPADDVRAAAANRPGRGTRTDLR